MPKEHKTRHRDVGYVRKLRTVPRIYKSAGIF